MNNNTNLWENKYHVTLQHYCIWVAHDITHQCNVQSDADL